MSKTHAPQLLWREWHDVHDVVTHSDVRLHIFYTREVRDGTVVLVNLACRFEGSVHIVAKLTRRIRQVTQGATERQVLPGVVIVGGGDTIAVCTWRDQDNGRIEVLDDPFGC